jgi:hypothetical protein
MAQAATVTPWSTIAPFVTAYPNWAGPEAAERLAAYDVYHKLYWSEDQAVALIRRNQDGRGIYVPKPKMIVDTTAHYLLKGMTVGVADEEADADLLAEINRFCLRERFYSRFQVAKLKGVTYGDWVLHITADPNKDAGTRLSINSVDPASYFPEFDTDDLEKRTGAKLVEQSIHPDDPSKTIVKILRYWQEYDPATGKRSSPLVWREECLWEMEGWNNPEKAVLLKTLIPASPLPPDITAIPLYHFKNAEWDGYDFGNSELKGYERIFQGIDQAISDEEIALALVGLGVYATDAGRPRDSQGNETDWIVAPGTVWEMPGATMVKRLEGISTVTPVLDHVGYLESVLLDASQTSEVALGRVDAQTAESPIALALKFQPTLAKIEYRDTAGVEILTQMWYDWKFWLKAYESLDFTETEIVIKLGDKLPMNRIKIVEELNNLKDRGIISAAYFREQLELRLGYVFPATIAQDIIDEKVAEAKAMLEVTQAAMESTDEEGRPSTEGPGGRKVGAGDTKERKDLNQSNNRPKVNESKGTEVKD